MGGRLEQFFPMVADADGFGVIYHAPNLKSWAGATVHPNTASTPDPYGPTPYSSLYLYPANDRWYRMDSAGNYGPLLHGEEPASTFNSMSGDPWFAAKAAMDDDAGARQYGFQWYSTAAVTNNHNVSYVGNVFCMNVTIASGKTESSPQYLSYFYANRDADTSPGTLDSALYAIYVECGHDAGAGTPQTDYVIGSKVAGFNVKGTIDNLYAYEAQPIGGAGTTALYTAFYAHGGMGTESIGWRASSGVKEIWEFDDTTLTTFNADATDVNLGSGRNYNINGNGNYYLDSFTAVVKRDGAEVRIFNKSSGSPRTYTIRSYGSGGTGSGGTSGWKTYSTSGGDLSLTAGHVLFLLYNSTLDSGAGGWIAAVF